MTLRSKLSTLREYLTPINNESNFHSTGEISPDEFVKAGDYLVFKFPTWQWGSCPPQLRKNFLPADKQFLVTRHVPSYRRVSSYLPELVDEKDADGEWDMPCFKPTELGNQRKGDTSVEEVITAAQKSEIDDLDDLIEDDVEDDVEGLTRTTQGSDLDVEDEDFMNIDSDMLLTRKYDLYISYLTSYRVPKMYLVGFNANGIPLLPNQMYEDISGDYKDKTATIENLPMSYNTTSVSIHPCKHSSVMKVFMKHSKLAGLQKLNNGEEGEIPASENDTGIRVDQYLVVFLKFIASVTPGIEYDFTMDAL